MHDTYEPGEYLDLLKAYYALEQLTFSPDDPREAVLSALEERSEKKRVIAEKVNAIVDEYVTRFEKEPGLLERDDLSRLEQMYDSLTDKKTGRELDLGIMLRISIILKDRYKRAGREYESEYVKFLHECVTNDRVLIYNHTSLSCESPYLSECLEMANRFDELSEADRVLLFHMLYYAHVNHEDDRISEGQKHPIERLLEAEDNLRERLGERYPEYLDKAGAVGIARNSLSLMLEHFLWMARHGKAVDIERFRPPLERYTAILRRYLETNTETNALTISLRSTLLYADYRLGTLSLEELLDELTRMQSDVRDDESPTIQATRLGKLNYHYLVFLYRFSGYDRKTVIEMSQQRIRETLPRILKITREVNNTRFNNYLMMFILGSSYTSRFEDFSNLLLELTVYSDKALYVHTEMVKELSLVLFDHLIETHPDAFDGVAGRDAAYIRTHKEEMRRLLSECCMFHDIGKFFMLDIVGNSMRRLTDEEYSIIRMHPDGFDEFGRDWMEQDEHLHCIRDCAVTHHLWHDGTRGYPAVRHTKNRPFVDILAIADSLDAATDGYGRPYRFTKSLDDLIGEFRQGAGTRYGPEAVSALADQKVQDRLQF
ncbi:MAG: hypothetical protein J5843_01660, partial [Clostridia bacterium]|nr:hypothetical protein [Clostridia bacterium]